MDQLYYQEYYTLEREHWWFVARAKIITGHLRKITEGRTGLRILNIGAATGRTSELLEEFGTVKSIEFDEECFQFTKSRCNIDLIKGSILDLPFEDASFDLVCAFDVIEHVEDDHRAVSEMQRVCKKAGIVAVTVPAFMFLWSRHDAVNHHFRRYTQKQLLSLFGNRGQFLFYSYFNFWLFFPIALFRVFIARLLPQKKDRKDSGSDFGLMGKKGIIQTVFQKIFASESFFISRAIRLPVGVSVISTWRK